MATGLEVLGAVAASFEVVKIAKACLSAFEDVRQITLRAREQNEAQFDLLIQGLRFERWCFSLGIQDVINLQISRPNDWRRTDEIIKLEERLESQLRLKNSAVIALTRKALEGMHERFHEASTVLRRYSQEAGREASTQGASKVATKWNKLWGRGGPSSEEAVKEWEAVKSKGQSSLSLSAKWLTTDKNVLHEHLENLKKINDLLLELLQPTLQTQVGRRADMAILDHLDYSTISFTQVLPLNSDLNALARIKRWQAHEQKKDQDDNSSLLGSTTSIVDDVSDRRARSYQVQDFKKGTLRYGEQRSLSGLDGTRVMIEWKYYSKDQPVRMEQTLRLGELVSLFNRNNLFRRFSTLPCQGLVHDIGNSRIGIVFSTNEANTGMMTTLQDKIRSEETPPPLGQRFHLARDLVTALHHLHSVNWFHKSIRSDNIICFQSAVIGDKVHESQPRPGSGLYYHGNKELSATITGMTQPPPPLSTFYLVGWDLSRPDYPAELSETLSISTMGFQNRRDAIKIYSHPDTQVTTSSGTKPRYRAEFDIYSMGLVLLEIGLWRTMDTIRSRCSDDKDFRARLLTGYCDRLLPKMGTTYWRVVQRCLSNDFDLPVQEGTSGGNNFSLQVSFEKLVVSELEKCFA